MCERYFSPCHFLLSHITFIYGHLWFDFFECRLDGLLPTSGENFMSTAPLYIYLLRKLVAYSILLPAVVHHGLSRSNKVTVAVSLIRGKQLTREENLTGR